MLRKAAISGLGTLCCPLTKSPPYILTYGILTTVGGKKIVISVSRTLAMFSLIAEIALALVGQEDTQGNRPWHLFSIKGCPPSSDTVLGSR